MGLCLCSFPPHRAIRHSPPSTMSSQCLTQICGQESQLLQAFLSILCLNWKLHEDRCVPSFTKQDMHLVNVRRTEWMSESPFVPNRVSFFGNRIDKWRFKRLLPHLRGMFSLPSIPNGGLAVLVTLHAPFSQPEVWISQCVVSRV